MKRWESSFLAMVFALLVACGSGSSAPTGPTAPAAPTALTYTPGAASYVKDVAISPNLPTVSGGAATAFSTAPALPSGLVLDTTTGAITGTPTAITAATAYVITASNAGGSAKMNLTLDVKDQPPAHLTYSVNPAVHTVGMGIVPNTPASTGGAIVTYAVNPILPVGLVLNASTGVITGTPTAAAAQADYTITGTNSGGSTTCALNLTVNPGGPSFVGEPLDAFVYVNQRAQFNAAAAGTSLTYQWMRNGAAIPGATGNSFALPFASLADDQAGFSVEVKGLGGSITSRTARLTVGPLTPVPSTYTSFDGTVLNLYAWEGKYTAILSRSNALSVADMTMILAATDATYDYYQSATGYTPASAKVYHGKLTLADVPATCGAGCGYLGATGIEMQNTYFDNLINRVHTDSQFDQVFFYEFGRNFWSLQTKLEYSGADNTGTITTGFAVFMRFMAMDAAAVQGAPYGTWTFADFRSRVEGMIDLYLADTSQTWANTLKAGHAQANNPSGLGATDLFASFCFRLMLDHGGSAFINKLWVEAAKRPVASTTQDAVDSFFLAACAASGKNLTTLFETTWRWPLSAAAKSDATRYSTDTGGATAPANLNYSGNPAVHTVGVDILPHMPSSTGGTITSYSVNPALPAGLVLNASTGFITGTPTAATVQATYTITGTNPDGSTACPLVLAVNGTGITLTAQPQTWVGQKGQTASFSVQASGTGPLTYQWFRNGAPIPGATTNTYTTAPVLDADDDATFSVKIQDDHGTSILSGIVPLRVAQGSFSATGYMLQARRSHTSTVLANGKVLITGGYAPGALNSAELYDPATGTFSPTGKMVAYRTSHQATLLQDGRVLLTGGWSDMPGPEANFQASAEIYDPATGAFAPTGNMVGARGYHRAVRLADGKVLVVGGKGPGSAQLILDTAELFDPATQSFTALPPMNLVRLNPSATLLPNGRVLVAGGSDHLMVPQTGSELFDPVRGTFIPTGAMVGGRANQAASLMPNGKVLVAWGATTAGGPSVETYDPATGAFMAVLPNPEYLEYPEPQAHLLQDGRVLLTGLVLDGLTPGFYSQVFDPSTKTLKLSGAMVNGRLSHAASLLPNGKVILTGGVRTYSDPELVSAEVYQP